MEQTINTGGGTYVSGKVEMENGDFVGGDKIVYHPPQIPIPTPSEPAQIPEVASFVGRAVELAIYTEKLGQIKLAAIRGLPGVGENCIGRKLSAPNTGSV